MKMVTAEEKKSDAMPRGNHRSLSNVDHRRIVSAFVEGYAYQVVDKDFGIARQIRVESEYR